MVKEGKSLDEIKTAMGEAPAAAPAGGRGGPAFPGLPEIVYNESKK